jgi:predicted Zn-dependent protease
VNFSARDKRHLDAAEGWLGLGDWQSANDELEEIAPEMRAHPDVIKISYEVYSKAKKWEMASEVARGMTLILPENSWGFIHYAFSLHEMKRTKEAQAVLLPVADKFPDEHLISYNLACYCCQLGQLKEAMRWLRRAIDLAGKKDIRLTALNDPDLEPLWNDISAI